MRADGTRFQELWDLQDKFTRKFWETKGGMPPAADLPAVTKDYVIHAVREALEVLDEVPWKMHRSPAAGQPDRSNLLEEVVDAQKFLMGLLQVWGFSAEEVAEEFRRKSMVVEQRFAQERDFANLVNHPVAIVDIDGVLADYPKCFYRWVSTSWDGAPLSAARAAHWYHELPLLKRAEIKRAYRMSGAKAHLPVLPGARELLMGIRSRGLKVILMTNRPYAEHYRIYPDTLEWLERNGLEYDAILWSRDKGIEAVKNFKNVCFAVDDEEGNVRRLREAGITVIEVDPGDDSRDTRKLMELAHSTPKIEDLGYNWKEYTRGLIL